MLYFHIILYTIVAVLEFVNICRWYYDNKCNDNIFIILLEEEYFYKLYLISTGYKLVYYLLSNIECNFILFYHSIVLKQTNKI